MLPCACQVTAQRIGPSPSVGKLYHKDNSFSHFPTHSLSESPTDIFKSTFCAPSPRRITLINNTQKTTIDSYNLPVHQNLAVSTLCSPATATASDLSTSTRLLVLHTSHLSSSLPKLPPSPPLLHLCSITPTRPHPSRSTQPAHLKPLFNVPTFLPFRILLTFACSTPSP